jgi:hypothetical protein
MVKRIIDSKIDNNMVPLYQVYCRFHCWCYNNNLSKIKCLKKNSLKCKLYDKLEKEIRCNIIKKEVRRK